MISRESILQYLQTRTWSNATIRTAVLMHKGDLKELHTAALKGRKELWDCLFPNFGEDDTEIITDLIIPNSTLERLVTLICKDTEREDGR